MNPASEASGPGAVAPPSVLIVDDDDFVRAALTHQFQSLGVTRIETAADGQQALSRYHQDGPFDVVLLDLMMPNTDGVELLRRFARMGGQADLILTSGLKRRVLDTAETLAKAHALSVLGVLPKPVKAAALRELLARRGEGQGARQAASEMSAAQISDALERGLIVPHFQPKMCARTGSLVSVEALARWIDPERGAIAPDRFIPAAEKAGLACAIARQITTQSFEAMRSWQALGFFPELEINLSAVSLADLELPDRASELASLYCVDPDRVTFEITESALIDRLADSLDTLTRMRLKGFRLAIDDFGTGYATFTQLKMLPLTELKIDRSFVARLGVDADARSIVQSCLNLATHFKLVSVAEGVEDVDTATQLRDMGATLLQGFLYTKALPADALREWWLDRALAVSARAAPATAGAARLSA